MLESLPYYSLAVHDLSLIKDKSWTFTKIKDFWGKGLPSAENDYPVLFMDN
jgi:hypothetical protein